MTTQNTSTSTSSTGTVSRALQLLAVLAESNGPVTVKQVSEQMGLAPSTAHRLLNLLRKDDFVAVVSGGSGLYSIGPEFYRVAAQVMSAESKPALAQNSLDEIASEFNETVLFGTYAVSESAMSFAAIARGEHKLQYQIDLHKPMSLVWGASGKAILAYLDQDTIERVYAKAETSPAQDAPLPALESLLAELSEVRQNGYAHSMSEKLPDARGVAAPVFDNHGIVGCICLTMPTTRVPSAGLSAITAAVIHHAEKLSEMFGYRHRKTKL
ncbi:IclR family transcriptional regulator [Providencia rettgeri]|uniref:IclR family transcriptional regulator n=1 Tax=Alcaligenes parafaecalis TaxID=171260 RepID=A0ABT3VJK8_9BURK|nr:MULTISPECIES: IclR family transcriptional regulator [Alcaligenes]MBY6345113.1 IclR family transcriptional regulator [Providencia rettgeri]MCX5463385.1 IclR family transcriptional regulator [Alcaligenes parafaecalis]QTC00816.1 IclR family transcriptional regulator [Alcaligenes sp. SORT26]